MWRLALIPSLLLAVSIACSSSPGSSDAGGTPDSGSASDAGGGADAGPADGGPVDSGCPDAGTDTWCGWANGFFNAYCDACHVPGASGDPAGAQLDFTRYAMVQAKQAEIRCGVANSQDPAWACAAFPPPAQFPVGTGPKPSAAERGRLVAWIDAGAPQ
jgi:hypothetical protein